ncbi:efflux RND transporter permease subunit [uncultured Megamonas sp.]|uniref:efflux RND transporter permease subunit n=1 Tax=uncultured Megamonas sp. TaxID=286140 RepID=UPI00266FE301|nr:multidrug efflux RND transporter permease subunit [uncultured Megamonas sp.]
MSRFFINRPIFAIVISIIIVILGTISAFNLAVDKYPQISPPTVTVSTTYTGANSDTVNETIAQVIEQQVNGVEGMDYMSSTSSNDGRYSLQVVFKLGTDGDMDSVKVQNNASTAEPSLPSDVQSYGLTTRKASSDMAMVLTITSPNGTYDSVFLKNYADIYLVDKIKRVPGVGDLNVFGADYAMRLWINPDKLAELGLTVADVINAVKEQNVQAPAGTIGQMPAPKDQEFQYTGKVQGRLVTPEEFGNIIIRSDNNSGSFIRVKDVAKVETGARTNNISSKHNNKNSVGFGVQLTSDANAMSTVSQVKEILEEAKADFPPDMEYETVVDNTTYISESIIEVVKTFVEALVLVMLIVYIFLQSWRATLIPMLAVPVSLIGTFAAFIVLDFTINTLTLFGMVLAIGLVVDDAIVVIENVERHMAEDGLDPKEATGRAMDEVQGPVVAIAFTLASVFIPVAGLGGMTGVLYRQFALTIAISMALSAFVALTLTPALCATLLKPHTATENQSSLLGSFFIRFNQFMNWLTRGYVKRIAFLIGKAKYCVAFLIIITALMGALFKILPTTFIPAEDQGFYLCSVTLPDGTSLNHTEEVMEKLSAALQDNPGVSEVMGISGYDILSGGAKSNAATFFVGLKPWSERTTPETSIDTEVGMAIKEGLNYPEASIIAMNPPSLPGLGMVSGFNLQLQDMSGHTNEELDTITKKIVAAANQRPELQGVYTTYSVNSPTYEFEIDREKVKNLGLNISDVFTALQVNFGGTEINDFNQFGRTYKVVMQAEGNYRNEADRTRFIFIRGSNNQMVPLNTIIKPKLNSGPAIISRFNASRSVTIQGSPKSGYSSGQAMAAIEEVVKEVAPTGFNIDWSGQSREERAATSSTSQVMVLSLVFVFLCLAALYESWSVPYAVLLTVPTGIFGALLSAFVLNLQISIYMQIGIIVIIGLAAKNAILIVEFAKARVDTGMPLLKATLEAAKLRLRPIIMTSLAFIIGCLPLAVATGAGAAARNNMGVAVVGGMIFATALGVFLIPVMYLVVMKITSWLTGGNKPKPQSKVDKYM